MPRSSGDGQPPDKRPVSPVRLALSGLTSRGRAFVAAGLTCVAAGVVLDQLDLLRVGLLIAVLPLAAAAFLARARYRIAARRRVDRRRTTVGGLVRVELEVTNLSRVSTPLLLAQDSLPPEFGAAAGSGARFVLERIPAGGERSVGYAVRPLARGRFEVGPLSVRLTDPFGFCQLQRTFASSDVVTVLPETVPLGASRPGGQWSSGGETGSHGMSSGGEQDATTRPYVTGDDRRRVHWRTTARTGELTVRREEPPWQSQVTVLLDTRRDAHSPGRGATETSGSFEYAVSAVASISRTLIRSRVGVRLIDEVARVLGESEIVGSPSDHAIMDALADVEPGSTPTLLPVANRIGDPLGARTRAESGSVVAVLGRLSPGDSAALAQAAARNARCMALLIDADAWATGAGAPSAATLAARNVLRDAGWAVTVAGPRSPIDAAWQELNAGVPSRLRRWVG